MRIDRERLTFKALSVLAEIADNCDKQPAERTLGLRFALAYLYAVSNGNRQPFDEFWRSCCDPVPWAYSAAEREYVRGTYTRSALSGIILSVGAPGTVEFLQSLRQPAYRPVK